MPKKASVTTATNSSNASRMNGKVIMGSSMKRNVKFDPHAYHAAICCIQ